MQAGAGLNIVSYSQEKAFGFKFIVGLLVFLFIFNKIWQH